METERQYVGFLLMADAGFDPRAAARIHRQLSKTIVDGIGGWTWLNDQAQGKSVYVKEHTPWLIDAAAETKVVLGESTITEEPWMARAMK